ncbi:uncharacterized protein N7487_002975 [Penicillium crustosum]|uniref:uncharacterized protein n=1 Tax=Penicillium crustosum TaxID=36656 RepID=UPI002390391E|nr:uncharacterized protein N7487_002975 [Penicillium crustosum]KAJ5419425.1 hypothetical protein N7487_002975 [Penicillium crustosum]
MFDYLAGTTVTGFFCMGLASAGALLFGIDNGWWGTLLGAEEFLRTYGSCETVNGVHLCSLSTAQQSAGSSVQSAGIMAGSLISISVNNWLGRRNSLLVTGVISIIGVLIEITSAVGASARFSQLVVGKTIAALAMGLCANVVPIYLSETSTATARGFAVTMYSNAQVLGSIVAAGTVYATSKRMDAGCYYIPIGIQLLPPLCMIIGSPFLPESPRWLVLKGQTERAVVASSRLFASKRNNFDAQAYVRTIEVAIEEERLSQQSSGWMDLLRGSDLRRLLIAIGVQCLCQAQGSTYILNYVVSFLKSAGIADVFPVIMGIYSLYYVGILGGHYLPDRFGRRSLLMSTAGICGVCLLTIAIMITAIASPTAASRKAAIALIFIWELMFAVQSTVIWIVTTECAPSRNREKVLAIAVFFGFGISLLVASVSPYLQDEAYGNLGGKIGFIWGTFSIIAVIWTFFTVPEMKGFSLEELDHLFNRQVPTLRFKRYQFPVENGPEK